MPTTAAPAAAPDGALMITLDVDPTTCLAGLTDAMERQLPFATSKAINETAKDFQVAERARLHDIFHLNRAEWAERSIKITHFAKKTELWAEVAVSPPGSGGADKSDILGKFEDDTEKTPTQGHLSIAIPVDAKRGKNGVLKNDGRPKAFHLQRVNTRGTALVFRGDQRTFMIQMPDGRGWLMKRTGPGTHGSLFDGADTLFFLRPNVGITPVLQFLPTGIQTVDARFILNFEAAFNMAMDTAR
jgi:hypothetical protein